MSDPHIPPAPAYPGARHLHSGKVRDLYELTEGPYAGHLLMVASDRISIFDFVLASTIPDKGEILTRMSLWWFDQLADLVPHHVLSAHADDLPAGVAGRAVICERLAMYPVECVVRGYLTGSGLLDYRATGAVCGLPLPTGLEDGSRLPEPIFTPTTKGEVGEHDEAMTYDDVVATVGPDSAATLRELTLAVYARAEGIARERGIILADTKIELGRSLPGGVSGVSTSSTSGPGVSTSSTSGAATSVASTSGAATSVTPASHPDIELVEMPQHTSTPVVKLADEVLTPDSSRFWPVGDWRPGHPQPSYDKQIVRNWALSPESGWDRASGQAPPPLPPEVVEQTRSRYIEAYELLTGETW